MWRLAALLIVMFAIAGFVRWWSLASALQALDRYDNHVALRWLEWSVRFHCDAREIALARVRAYRRLRQFDRVRSQLLQARTAGVPVRRLEREQWLTLAQSGQLEQVEAKLPLLLNDSEIDVRDVCEAYVTGFLLTARSGQALELIVPWLADFPRDAQAYYLQGQAHIFGRHYLEAEAALRKARELAPERPDIALTLGESLLELQQPKQALPLFQAATAEPELSNRASIGMAKAARRAGEATQAIQVLEALLIKVPDDSEAWEELGRTQLDLNQTDSAIQSLNQAVKLSPKSYSAHQALGSALVAKGDTKTAAKHLDLVTQGNAAREQIRLLEDQSELRPRETSIRFQIAELYQQNDTPNLAIAWARSVLAIDPTHTGAQKLLQELIPTGQQ